jgi:hypothetical protein
VQVFTAKIPFSHIENDVVVLNKILNGERPSKPVGCESVGFNEELWDVMQRGWTPDPDSRATLGAFFGVLGGEEKWGKRALPVAANSRQLEQLAALRPIALGATVERLGAPSRRDTDSLTRLVM